MKQDRGEQANKLAGIGNTVLFVAVLAALFYLMLTQRYQFAMALSLAGIYSETWNMRVSSRRER